MTTAADSIAGLYDRHAAGWDDDRRHRRPDGEAAWITRFAALAGSGASVLDLGCGSGAPIVPDLRAAGLTVTGVDASPSLIALCRERFPDQAWVVADMRRIDLGRFGGLLLWHSLFHLPPDDQAAMFPVLARHLTPGAPLMFTSGTERGETVGQWRGEPLYHASLDLSDYEGVLADNGLRLIERVVGDASCGGATIWLAVRL
ncbi:class I SAM-dependent methyltransferase [Asticcacaulis sp. BYS171W]|uniref:Class I SAM-dependent methyltransferase n=1 Tax=Asticcacaulis aquaticus TaxID=2984212 RepID=A0ABT5HV54_9CAUL|nr:class I SAM-dependent methyltransferase [Asticcacaulis aquaticus]MDC7683950.1 class I SAM-dependent methyltransferase [Asticcacaulis aquaticus]